MSLNLGDEIDVTLDNGEVIPCLIFGIYHDDQYMVSPTDNIEEIDKKYIGELSADMLNQMLSVFTKTKFLEIRDVTVISFIEYGNYWWPTNWLNIKDGSQGSTHDRGGLKYL